MSKRGYSGDLSALLYLAPFAVSGVYAIYLWAKAGVSLYLPQSVYLEVTRDPYVFVIGTVAVILGLIVDETSVGGPERKAKLESLGDNLQKMALASLVLALVSVWYANQFTHISSAANDLIVGRYALVFPAMMYLLSYLITAKLDLGPARNRKILGILAMLLVPVAVYELARRSAALGLGAAFLLVLVGLALFFMNSKKPVSKE
ncbi:MAG: hypothetical protein HY296_00805 [Thaumarchaeota archaeon]|nr:hypothetical protein [Nitrososphaerota archaeon]